MEVRKIPLETVVWFQEGPGVRNTQYTTEGVKLLNVANLVDGELDLSTSSRFISTEEAYGKYRHFLVDEGDFIIASSGIKVEYFEKKMGFVKKQQLPLCMNTSTIRFKILNPAEYDIRYFMYFLKSNAFKNQLSRQITGSAQLNFGPSHLKKMSVPATPIGEQRSIAAILDKITSIIKLNKKILSLLDQLVKSQFIEMFGEVGSDKNGWGIHPFSEFCEINPKKGSDARIRKGMDVSFVPMQSVSEQGDIDVTAVKTYEEVQKGFTYFSEDDVLFAKITPCMENGKGAIARGLKNSVGFGSTEFHVIRPKTGVSNSEWIYAITSFPRFRQDAARKMTGSAGQRRVPASFLASYMVSCPPFELQEQYARFVEQTDKSKFRIKQSLEKLETLYKALLQKYFG